MRRAAALFACALLALAGCAPAGPPYDSVAATIPSVPQGAARIYFYRWLEPYETLAATPAMLNGTPVGVTRIGTIFYRDVAPGRYTISVRSQGLYPNQFKTVTIAAGQTMYVRIESLRTWVICGGSVEGGSSSCGDTFTVEIIDPAVAQAEMSGLQFIHG